ncbi:MULTISPECIES: hypothetical protein [Trichocoleus]|uniref:Uncharacterized protein n=1 Tax=Trichocoleus desertorum GB2-A4 TaxID=2933944 RepID=A0ABV0JGM5_9CYAN|nr:hypothetical protein [Trichocoleus sp. FACHB-46]MBD1865637.1 hypothetical protein [Trichocoleus sp. FACHB-46]
MGAKAIDDTASARSLLQLFSIEERNPISELLGDRPYQSSRIRRAAYSRFGLKEAIAPARSTM